MKKQHGITQHIRYANALPFGTLLPSVAMSRKKGSESFLFLQNSWDSLGNRQDKRPIF